MGINIPRRDVAAAGRRRLGSLLALLWIVYPGLVELLAKTLPDRAAFSLLSSGPLGREQRKPNVHGPRTNETSAGNLLEVPTSSSPDSTNVSGISVPETDNTTTIPDHAPSISTNILTGGSDSSSVSNLVVTINDAPTLPEPMTGLDGAASLRPQIIEHPVSQHAVAGMNVTFSVTATGNAPLNYQWRKDGVPISGETTPSLTLARVESDDSGDYTVVVSHRGSSETSRTARLSVSGALRQGWIVQYDGSKSGNDAFVDVKVSSEGAILAAGYAETERGKDDFITAKYAPDGQLLWRALYDGPRHEEDRATALEVDQAGNVYVTGWSTGSDGREIATIKYEAGGKQSWVVRHRAGDDGDAWPSGLAVDAAGNIYVTGTSKSSGRFGYVTLKYAPDGSALWKARYVGLANSEAYGSGIGVTASGEVYVTGRSKGSGTDFDYATVKYDARGELLWTARYNGPANSTDRATALLVDARGNAFVTGESKGAKSDYDVATIKYSPDGDVLWITRYDNPSQQEDRSTALTLDTEGNLIVIGAAKTATDFDYLTLKYNPAGSLIWDAVADGTGSGSDEARAVRADVRGNICVTGTSKSARTGFDFATLEYTAEGKLLWAARYDGSSHGDDGASALALDSNHSLFIAGQSQGKESDLDATLLQYGRAAPLVIVANPESQVAEIGTTVTLTAAAVGTPPLSWQWRRNEVAIPGAVHATLVLEKVQPTDGGNYQAVVWNGTSAAATAVASLAVLAKPMAWADDFSDRVLTDSISGLGQGTNSDAGRESGEPRHSGRSKGKSVWHSWRAPTSGIASISTAGSDFDTVLAVYTGNRLGDLRLVAKDDDSGGFLASKVVFNAVAGAEYHIAVEGVNGASGKIVLAWGMEITADRMPVIAEISAGRTVGLGQDVTYSISVTDGGASYQWFRDDKLLEGATGSTLTIREIKRSDIGSYSVQVTANGRQIKSHPIQLQVGHSDRGIEVEASAQDKFADIATLSEAVGGQSIPARRPRPIGPLNAPSRGFSGTQIFSTYGATREPGEPEFCGVVGGASKWYAYEASAGGILVIDTGGSDFDTAMAVYTGDGSNFETLVLMGCDDNSGPDGRSSAVRIPATAGTTYYIAVDGVNGATGQVVLNYTLGDPPTILSQPLHRTVPPGGSTTFQVLTGGNTPCTFQWRFNGTVIPGATQGTLQIANVQPANAGNYSVLVSNLIAVVISTEAQLTVRPPMISIGGNVTAWGSGRPLANVVCQLSGSSSEIVTSSSSGAYGLTVDPGGTYSLAPVPPAGIPTTEGVTTFDLALIRQQILGMAAWDTPFRFLAADLNRSGSITFEDITLARELILGNAASLPGGFWRFVPSDYPFPAPQNPWEAPGVLFYTSLITDLQGQNFTGIKIGDVNHSVLNAGTQGFTHSSASVLKQTQIPAVRFKPSSHSTPPGAALNANVTVSGFQAVTTTQFTLSWDPAVLRYLGVDEFGLRGLSAANFGVSRVQQGHLAVSWDDPQVTGVSLADGTSIFQANFEVVGNPGASSPLAIRSFPIPTETTVQLAPAESLSLDGQITVIQPKLLKSCKFDPQRGTFELVISTTPGVQYSVEFAESLPGTMWTNVSSFVGDGSDRWVGLLGISNREGYYRIRME